MNNSHFRKYQCGITIIELMIAMVLGLFATGVIISIFLTTSRNFVLDEQVAAMQENARFAMRTLMKDVGMAGFWGEMRSTGDIFVNTRDCTDSSQASTAACLGVGTGSTLTLATDCASTTTPPDTGSAYNTWVYDIRVPVVSLLDVSASEIETEYPCIDANHFDVGTNVLVVKRVRGTPITRSDQTSAERSADVGKVFLRTTGLAGSFLQYNNDDPGSAMTDWELLTHIYAIRNYARQEGDGVPTLLRASLNDDREMEPEPEPIAEGIEYFYVMYGIDTDTDGVANMYSAAPTAAELASAVTARLYILARTFDEDQQYTNDKSYVLGDLTIAAANDGYHRRVFTSTTLMRNPIYRSQLDD